MLRGLRSHGNAACITQLSHHPCSPAKIILSCLTSFSAGPTVHEAMSSGKQDRQSSYPATAALTWLCKALLGLLRVLGFTSKVTASQDKPGPSEPHGLHTTPGHLALLSTTSTKPALPGGYRLSCTIWYMQRLLRCIPGWERQGRTSAARCCAAEDSAAALSAQQKAKHPPQGMPGPTCLHETDGFLLLVKAWDRPGESLAHPGDMLSHR